MKVLLTLVVLVLRTISFAEEKKSEWVLLRGGIDTHELWTVAKLQRLDEVRNEKSEIPVFSWNFDNPIKGGVLTEVYISGVLAVPVIVDPHLTIKGDSVEFSLPGDKTFRFGEGLFLASSEYFGDVQLEICLPIDQLYLVKEPLAFVDKPKVIRICQRRRDLMGIVQLTETFAKNYSLTTGFPVSSSDIERLKAAEKMGHYEELESFWTKVLFHNFIPGIQIKYIEKFDTLLFSVPTESDEGFHEVCESVLSGNRIKQ